VAQLSKKSQCTDWCCLTVPVNSIIRVDFFTARCYAKRGDAAASCPSARLWRWGTMIMIT